MSQDSTFEARLQSLREHLRKLGSVAVAFSGGVDSTALLFEAHRVLGPEHAAGVIADSPSLPRAELRDAIALAESMGARLEIVSTDELGDERYRANSGDRCYWCKSALFRAMEPWAQRSGFRALAFGEITDDFSDDRPGARAAQDFGVVAPLSRAGLGKEDVRRIVREAGLPAWDKPASACLASRLPVGTRVTRERLARVEEAEAALKSHGLRQLRVRDRGAHARLEVGAEDYERAEADRDTLFALLRASGFETCELTRYFSPLEKAQRAGE